MTGTARTPLAQVVGRLVGMSGYSSPEKFAQSWLPELPPVSGMTIRRIADGADLTDKDEWKLTRMTTMFSLPPGTLSLVREGNRKAIERLDFGDQVRERRFILDLMTAPEQTNTTRSA